MEISIQSLCYDTWNLAEFTCGKFCWLDMIFRAQRQYCVEAQIWGRLQKMWLLEGSQEHNDLHNS